MGTLASMLARATLLQECMVSSQDAAYILKDLAVMTHSAVVCGGFTGAPVHKWYTMQAPPAQTLGERARKPDAPGIKSSPKPNHSPTVPPREEIRSLVPLVRSSLSLFGPRRPVLLMGATGCHRARAETLSQLIDVDRG